MPLILSTLIPRGRRHKDNTGADMPAAGSLAHRCCHEEVSGRPQQHTSGVAATSQLAVQTIKFCCFKPQKCEYLLDFAGQLNASETKAAFFMTFRQTTPINETRFSQARQTISHQTNKELPIQPRTLVFRPSDKKEECLIYEKGFGCMNHHLVCDRRPQTEGQR